eukprot:NODE_3044_length_825_cov_113.387887_g2530_i0.p1 GENE.NODE_3044_length_825_cov_113.387887_g2530_i0~~NODE_3044_length_825_cov_113.387887_g2530_i0.p1  ORF type:complete len:130 (-),score=9.73 NODE_3044_length_825_cov_113.387887_g2530_i0:137-526(-)
MALSYLRRRDELMQQHVLFALAANDVPRIQNLSKYLHRLVKIYEENPQLCMFFFADGCNDQCAFVHPTGTPGWEALRARGVDYRDFDYRSLDEFCSLQEPKRETILHRLSRQALGGNLSAQLHRLVTKK